MMEARVIRNVGVIAMGQMLLKAGKKSMHSKLKSKKP